MMIQYKNSAGQRYRYAMTARDIAAWAMDQPDQYGFAYDMSNSTLERVANSLYGTTTEFHGWKWDEATGYQVQDGSTRVQVFTPHDGNLNSSTGTGNRHLIFGMNESATGFTNFKTYGMTILTPYFHGGEATELTISKTVVGGDNAANDFDWSFQLTVTTPEEPEVDTYDAVITKADGSTEDLKLTFTYDGSAIVFDEFTLKHGETIKISGLPADAPFTVDETNGGNPNDDEFYASVTNSGADANGEYAGEYAGTHTEGTLNENGGATVAYSNSKAGGPAHLILDYNLNGLSASTTVDDPNVSGEITADTQVTCGIHQVGETVTVDASISGKVLNKGDTISLGTTSSGEQILATFQGVYTQASGGTKISDSTNFSYVLKHGDLTVLYCQWSIGTGSGSPSVPAPDDGQGQLYTVFWDKNYDGGGITSSLAGTWTYEGQIDISCGCGGGTGVFNPTLELKVKFSQPEDPVRDGYRFGGWAEEPDADTGEFTVQDPGDTDTLFAVWIAEDIWFDANGGAWETDPTNVDSINADKTIATHDSKVWHEEIPVPDTVPKREGYTFNGWYIDKNCTQPIETYEEGLLPNRTYYAGWTAEKVIVTYYDTREGTSVVHTQEYLYDDLFDVFDPMESTVGWDFTQWNTSSDGSGRVGESSDTGPYLNKAEWGDLLVYHASANEDDDPDSTMSAEGYWTLDFYAIWNEKFETYNVSIVWNDFNNNDRARPQSIKIGLVDSRENNSVVQEATVTGGLTDDTWSYTFTGLSISDNDSSLQKRTYGIVFLGYTDVDNVYRELPAPELDGQSGIIEMAGPSNADVAAGFTTTYAYGVNNYGSSQASVGYYDTTITFDHSLITTGDEIKFTIDWDDDSDNDGVRPNAVTLVLYGNGQKVKDYPLHNSGTGIEFVHAGMCEVTNDGDTWTYTFKDYQKYDQGVAIDYTVAITTLDGTTTYNENGYTVTYATHPGEDASAITAGDPIGCIISRPIEMAEVPFSIIWDDENNRDGQRPDFVSVVLMSYQWNEDTYRWEYVEMATQVVKADDVNTMTADEWTGTFGEFPVYHDGLEAIYHLQVTSDLNAFIPEGSFEYGWNESVYGNQKKVTPQVIISQNVNTVSVQAQVYWNDSQNNDSIRPQNVILQLYSHAPGEEPVAVPGAAYRVTISGDMTADNWYYTFSGMPKYAEGQSGVELIYTIQVFEVDGEPLYGYYIIDSNGEEQEVLRYAASYLTEATENDDNIVGGGTGTAGDEGTVETDDFTESDRAYVKLTHIAETQTMNFSVNWHDEDNRDNMRPESVLVDMYKTVGNNQPIYVQTLDITAGEYNTWTYRVTGLAGYENGQSVVYSIEVSDEFKQQLASIGYTVSTQDNIVHLYYTPGKGSITTQIYWSDDDNNDGYRPDSVIVELYANGVATGKTADLNATNNWTATWTDLDVNYVEGTQTGVNVVYSVQVETPEHYTVTYNPVSTTIALNQTLYVQLYHGGDVKPVPVTVYWNDNSDYDQRRPESLGLVTPFGRHNVKHN